MMPSPDGRLPGRWRSWWRRRRGAPSRGPQRGRPHYRSLRSHQAPPATGSLSDSAVALPSGPSSPPLLPSPLLASLSPALRHTHAHTAHGRDLPIRRVAPWHWQPHHDAHFTWTMRAPLASYSTALMSMPLNVDSDERIEPPIQACKESSCALDIGGKPRVLAK